MLRVLAQGMRELGLDPEAGTSRSAAGSATVPLDEKRQLVASALAQGGIACLAQLGRGLHRFADEPTHSALVSARDVPDLLARWARLERYIHSRHRVEVLALSDQVVRLAHLPKAGGPPPQPAEDLVVLGVLMALLQAIGATGLTALAGDVMVSPEPDAAALAAAAQLGLTAQWTIAWTRIARRPQQPERGVLPSSKVIAPSAWPAHAQRSFDTLCQDLSSPLTLPALAHAQGEAPRSLQRGLSRAGLTYTQLLSEARCRSASWWLIRTATPVAEVGYVCGYADQPHFTRDFRNRVGMTPLRYRREFTACSPGR